MDLSKLSDSDLLALQSGDMSKVSNAGLRHLEQSMAGEQPRGTGNPAADAANAVGTGFWRGATRLAGLPVDTVANVIDLGKAAIGAPYIALTGKAPPKWLEPADRANVLGSGDQLVNAVRRSRAGQSMVDPVNPEYEGGYLQTAGAGMAGAIAPGTLAQTVNRGAIGVLSSVAGKGAYDATGSQELAIAASMLPTGAQHLAEAGLKRVVRGDEQGRQQMQRRVLELERAGITDPTLGLASGNKLIGGIENLLQNTPGAIGVMGSARDNAIAGLKAKAQEAADMASPVRGALPAGQQIQSGIQAFKEGFKGTQAGLYNRLDQFIPSSTPTSVTATAEALAKLNADIAGAPALSKFFKNGKIQAIEAALQSDIAQPKTYTPGQLRAALATNPSNAAELNAALGEGRLPYQAVKQTRTLVGNEIADNSLMSDVPRSKWNPLYGGLSQDMQEAAQAAGPGATQAFNRANDYTRAGMNRLDALRSFADKAAPEQAFTSLANTTKENASVLQAVKKSLPEGARGTVAGTVIDRLGRATPGQQNELSDVWSPDRFLSNWNGMKPEARRELLSGFKNSDQVRADVEAIARAASMMRDGSKMWANPSGTAGALNARTMLAGGTLAGFLNPWAPVGVAAALGGANLAGRVLTGEAPRRFFLEGDVRAPRLTPAMTRAMAGTGLLAVPDDPKRARGLLDLTSAE